MTGTGTDGPELVGRERETALLRAALDKALAGDGGSAVMLRGEAGIGKSALLGWVRARAREDGFGVLGIVGAAAETGLAFGALHQIVWPLLRHPRGPALPVRRREALECALGLREGPPPGGVMLGGAALALLAAEARTRPLLIVLDDLHWVDTSSAAVFAFLHRRIADLPVVMVSAGRDEGAGAGGWATDLVRVPALEPAAAEELLRRRPSRLPAAESARVMEEARGNPLALLELPARTSDEEPIGAPEDGIPAAYGSGLEHLFHDRITSLSGDAGLVLLLTALGGSSAWDAGAWLGAAPGVDAEAVVSAVESSGLALLDDRGRLVFRHPLVRSAVISLATPQDQRLARRTLAAGLDADDPRRLTHEALAAVLPDEPLARRLEEAAGLLARRGGDAEGAALMDRAAALSPGPDAHARRLIRAAVMAARGGRLTHTARLVEELRHRPVPPGLAPLFAYAVVYVDQSHRIDFESSFRLLPQALDELAELAEPAGQAELPEPGRAGVGAGAAPFGGLAEQIYFKLLLAASYTDDPRAWDALDRHADAVSPLARLCRRAWSDPARTAHGVAGELAAMTAEMDEEQEAGAAWLLLWTASAVDTADETLWQRFTGQHAYATQGSIAKARFHHDFLRGNWDSARACLLEAEAADGLGYHCNALLFRHYHAHFLAGRGDEQGLRDVDALIRPAATTARLRFVTDHLTHLRALAALANGRPDDAYAVLARLMPPGTLPRGLPWFHLPFFDLVEAAVRTGRTHEARAHVAAGRAARMHDISGHHAFLLAAATAVTAPDADADAAYQAACAVPGADDWPFPMARLRLLHGSWLRRHRRAEATTVLRRAHAAFLALDATPWAEQCTQELAAITPDPRPAPTGPTALTGQELRIAHLAATGLSNKEIATRLQLSPRTVAAHLYKIFPKLATTSRAGIARALEGN